MALYWSGADQPTKNPIPKPKPMIRKALLLSLALLNLVPALEGASDVSVLAGLSKGGKFSGTNPKVFQAKKPKATAAKGTIRNTLNLGKGVTIKTEQSLYGAGRSEGRCRHR
jgi:hypothetical protein